MTMPIGMWRSMGVLMTVAGVLAERGLAVDAPAPCGRGLPGSTFQAWTFSTSANPAQPEASTNAYGHAAATIAVGLLGSGWLNQLPGFGSRQGYWDLGSNGAITLSVPVGPASPCYVAVQVVQYVGGPIEYGTVNVPTAVYLGGQRQLIEGVPPLGGWWLDLTLWRVENSPEVQPVQISGAANGSVIDEVVVDTWVAGTLCSTNLVLTADPGQCSRSNVTWTLPVTDTCAVTNIVCVPPSGSSFPVGTTRVECVALGASSPPAACAFTVTIEDPSAPPLRLSLRSANPTNSLLEIRWPVTCVSNVLEQADRVGEASAWRLVNEPPQRVGNEFRVTLPAGEQMRFYRVRQR